MTDEGERLRDNLTTIQAKISGLDTLNPGTNNACETEARANTTIVLDNGQYSKVIVKAAR